MRFNVPFVSQYDDLADPEWQWRGCGIVALKMVLDFWYEQDSRNETLDLNELHQKGLNSGAYRDGIGWTHRGLVDIVQSLGYESYNRDWAPNGPTPKTAEQAFQALVLELDCGPVLASVYSGFEPVRGGGHITVVTGMEDDLIFLNDPEQQNALEGKRALTLRSFLKAFKRRYIVIIPKDIFSPMTDEQLRS